VDLQTGNNGLDFAGGRDEEILYSSSIVKIALS